MGMAKGTSYSPVTKVNQRSCALDNQAHCLTWCVETTLQAESVVTGTSRVVTADPITANLTCRATGIDREVSIVRDNTCYCIDVK